MLSKWMTFLAGEREAASERPTRPSGPDAAEWYRKDSSRVTKRVTTQGDDTMPTRERTKPRGDETKPHPGDAQARRGDETQPSGPTYRQQAMQLRMRHSATNTFYHYSFKK